MTGACHNGILRKQKRGNIVHFPLALIDVFIEGMKQDDPTFYERPGPAANGV